MAISRGRSLKRYRMLGLLALIMLAAILLTAMRYSPVSTAAGGVTAALVSKDSLNKMIDNPTDAGWGKVIPRAEADVTAVPGYMPPKDIPQETLVPLSANRIVLPGGGTTSEVRVRAAHDGDRFAIRVQWEVPIMTDGSNGQYTDMQAIEFPVESSKIPYQCMGQSDSQVNIWRWMAQWQRTGQTPVQNLVADGICRQKANPGLNPQAKGVWLANPDKDGKNYWYLVYSRDFNGGDPETAQIERDNPTSMAFAVWNGSRGEVKSAKAVSTWVPLTFGSASDLASQTSFYVRIGVFAVISLAIIVAALRFLPRL